MRTSENTYTLRAGKSGKKEEGKNVHQAIRTTKSLGFGKTVSLALCKKPNRRHTHWGKMAVKWSA